MSQPFRPAPVDEPGSQGVIAFMERLDHAPLDANVIRRVQMAAQRIRQVVKRTLEDLIAVGNELLAVKHELSHGHFGPWLRAEFGWTERTARNFMTVAQRFGPRAEMISDLRIDPTAAYLLAAPSVPEAASEAALQRAEFGERITVAIAREILGTLRNRPPPRSRASSAEQPPGKLLGLLLESLESFRRRWDPPHVSVLARHLREFADSLEAAQGARGSSRIEGKG
jgi:hypothetical protein